MKTFRFLLPIAAFLFAIVGAVASELMPPVQAYYISGGNCSTTTAQTDQSDCSINLSEERPLCTVNVSGHPTAFNDSACQDELRRNP